MVNCVGNALDESNKEEWEKLIEEVIWIIVSIFWKKDIGMSVFLEYFKFLMSIKQHVCHLEKLIQWERTLFKVTRNRHEKKKWNDHLSDHVRKIIKKLGDSNSTGLLRQSYMHM